MQRAVWIALEGERPIAHIAHELGMHPFTTLGDASAPGGPAAGILLLGYSSSKAAPNMLTVKWARAHPRWRINSADPGFTATDLNAHRGTQTVHEGTDAIVRLACLPPDGPTGTFVGREGTVPW